MGKIKTYTYSKKVIKQRREELLNSEHYDKWVVKKVKQFIPELLKKGITAFNLGN